MTHFKVFSLDDAVSYLFGFFIYIFFKYTDNQ